MASRTGRAAPTRVEEDTDRTLAEEERRRTDWERAEREHVAGERTQHDERERERPDRERAETHTAGTESGLLRHEERWDGVGRVEEPREEGTAEPSDGRAPDPDGRRAELEEQQSAPRPDGPADHSGAPEEGEGVHASHERAAPFHLAPAQMRSVRGEASAAPQAGLGNGARTYTSRQKVHSHEAEAAARRTAGARR
ncbi:hypothetical protein [Nocardiopsis kunsanensis]|uniref:hypothetical protein n=1 Tax=Nocardiopsis kunsanensis TaxID=141693 RepID=UPI0003479254|nr:hypothetical protein [Nocardiopsis kunsanensis]